jgi:hypothetical protein
MDGSRFHHVHVVNNFKFQKYGQSVRNRGCNVGGYKAQCESDGELLNPLDVPHMPMYLL